MKIEYNNSFAKTTKRKGKKNGKIFREIMKWENMHE